MNDGGMNILETQITKKYDYLNFTRPTYHSTGSRERVTLRNFLFFSSNGPQQRLHKIASRSIYALNVSNVHIIFISLSFEMP